MEERKDFYQVAEEICTKDPRYKADAYEFIMQALHFTQAKLKKEGHITGVELLGGIRDLAIEQWGQMAKAVLNHWGISKTQDFGNIVFNMIDKSLLSKTETDSIDDFRSIYDFDSAFGNVLRDSLKDTG